MNHICFYVETNIRIRHNSPKDLHINRKKDIYHLTFPVGDSQTKNMKPLTRFIIHE
jgi:hypothetical protein